MSYMTTKLRYIVEQALDNQLANHDESNWHLVYGDLGLDDYPIWTAEGIQTGECVERTRINNKLIRHYYMREIGLETVGLFRWYLREGMHLIMPYYNQLYYSAYLIKDPTKEYAESEVETHTEDVTGNTKTDSTSDGTSSNTNIFSNTPENMIPTGEVKNLRYATTVTYDDGTTSDTSNANTDTTSKTNYGGQRDKSGRRVSEAELVAQYRRQIMNIDRMIIDDDEIAQCFMLVYE